MPIHHFDIRAHETQKGNHAIPRGVHAHMPQQQIGTRRDAGADQEKSGAGNIRRHVDPGSGQTPAAGQADAGTLPAHGVTKPRQHTFGVIARRRGFGGAGLALRKQTRQQHTGFDLGADNRQDVIHTVQGCAAMNAQRTGSICAAIDPRAHRRQRLGHPPHGAFRQRNITDQCGIKRLTRQHAGHKPHGGA